MWTTVKHGVCCEVPDKSCGWRVAQIAKTILIEASPILSSGELSSLLHRLTFVQLYDKRERDDDATLSTHVSDTIVR